MKTSKPLVFSILAFILSALFISCTSDEKVEVESNHKKEKSKAIEIDKQLNLTILLDLSDRIEPTKYPTGNIEHFERDIELVSYFAELFKKDMEKKGAFKAKGKMKVIFSPRPQDSDLNQIASKLSVDLSKSNSPKDKKVIFDNVSTDFRKNLSKIYTKTIETKNYPGSDVWRFFKNDVADFCIEDNDEYRNILVLITDGYLYHENSVSKQKNRSSSLLPRDIASNGLRNNWEEKFEKNDFGYISTRSDLKNLDVLVLEINPLEKYKNDEDVIKAYLTKWFNEMNVNSFKLCNSDLPEYTKSKIDKFISN